VTTTSGTAVVAVDAAQLYERYGHQIYRYCLGRLRDREEAADAAQNTFLRVHVALEKGVVPQYEASWLYKIAHNVCLSWIESSGRRALVETTRDLDSLDEAVLAGPASEHERVEELAEALAALPRKLRHAMLLREWQGLSYTEIAAAMDTTVPAVETLLVRARRQMAAALERSGTRLRRAATAVFDVLGLRGLLTGSLEKITTGAALVAVGGAGIGATAALSGRPSPSPPRPATSIAQPSVAVLRSGTTAAAAPAGDPRKHAAAAPGATHRVSTPDVTPPGGSSPSPAVQSPAPPAPGSAPSTSTVTSPAITAEVAVPSLPQAPVVSTSTLPALPTPSQVEDTVTTALPATTPTVTVPAVSIP
jgi:RNA polymerase sigma-70 factor, ECF subfamily